MKNTKHTPGPWEDFVIPSRHFESTDFTIQIRAQHPEFPMHHRIVANLGMYDYADNEREANAKLIAAAPELLQELQDVYNKLRSLANSMKTPRRISSEIYSIMYDANNSAIKKATE